MSVYPHVDSAKSILPGHVGGPFSSYEIYPKGVHFETQDEFEKVFILLRPHILSNIGWVFTSGIIFVIPMIIVYLIIQFEIPVADLVPVGINFDALVVIIIAVYYSFFFSYAFSNFIDWFYDMYVVSNERLLDYEFTPVSSVHVSELALADIQDIKESKIGFLPTVFGYGDITVSTASKRGSFKLRAVADPSRFRNIIDDLGDLIRKTGHTDHL